ncbi:MAG: hypothetical protein U0414_43145 [Polyangiaceae bacterium]
MAKTVALTAVGGMVVGIVGCGSSTPEGTAPAGGSASPSASAAAADAPHCCAKLNSCAGKGGCKTDENKCRGLNSCKNKGGCHSEPMPADCPAKQ